MNRLKLLTIRLRGIGTGFWLALLSFCLVVVIDPATAADRPTSAPTVFQSVVEASPDPSRLLTEGKQRYDAGQFTEAANVWQQAAQLYEAQGKLLDQALSLSYLSLSYQELGDWKRAKQAITTSLKLLKPLPTGDRSETAVLAQALNVEGKLQLALGQAEAALETWQTAERTYTQLNDAPGIIGSQINQAQALQTLGMYRRAQMMLEQVRQQLQGQPPSTLKVAGLQNLGAVLQVVGDFTNAQAVLQESLTIARQLNQPSETSATLFSLGNTLRAAQDSKAALLFYQQAADVAPTATARLEAQVNQLSLLIETQEETLAQALVNQTEAQLNTLPSSRAGIYIRVNWAVNVMRGRENWPSWNASPPTTVAKQLAIAVQQSRQLQDSRSESFALGHLGRLYEQTNQWTEAHDLTQNALLIAQNIDAADIAYRWQWQLGRIDSKQGNRSGAIAAYSEAVNDLKSLRRDLVAMSPDVQFSFKEAVEPVYRELVALLLQTATPSQKELQQARQVIEALQQAELENFLRSACLELRISEIDKADPFAAIIYPIILTDRLSVIVSLPGQPLSVHSTLLSPTKIEAVLEQTLESLNPVFDDQERLRLSGDIYNWLIRPAEASLAKSQVKTLIFVLDGTLRNFPMAALHDGQRYLIEKYSVGITPGLQLLGPQTSLQKENLQAVVAALTEARQGSVALPGVALEAKGIATQITAKELFNQNFTQSSLQAQLQSAGSPIVHLATHGQFSSNLNQTFILAWDKRLTIDAIRTSLKARSESRQRPIELLVLSACETAEGDKRSALGLAGLAVRSGARSTLASLWAVNDASTTELMVKFYQSLKKQNVSKAEALRQSQLELLHSSQYQHPFYWAPFILVGNWL